MRFATSMISAIMLGAAPMTLAANFAVSVGAGNSFAFSPTEIHPNVGDTVTFNFLTRNHSATTTTFTNPCPPPAGGVAGGFDTGFQNAVNGNAPSVTITITDTAPHWVACRQAAGAHCRMGMTFAINPTTSQTYAQFLANARAS
ncbi:hypothetical protein HGRIS_005514 [Hohenbuehelia grisea]|uniref:Cupredoxin n=1 Tax=Hohenbuehelia grisea TaxID=104357 RepID=A0ABR3JY26_9AGAR